MPAVTRASTTAVFLYVKQSANIANANVGKSWYNALAITHQLFIGINHHRFACTVQIKRVKVNVKISDFNVSK